MKKIFKVIWNIVKTIFIVIISLYLFFIILNKVSTKCSIFGYRILTISNTTMSSVYNINDVILVKGVNNKKLKVGDDITYKGTTGGLEGTIVTSRIEKIEKDKKGNIIYTTKGVDTPVLDPSINEKQIFGKVIVVIPVISQLYKVLKLPLGFFLFVFCPLFIIILFGIILTFKDMKEDITMTRRIEVLSSKLSKKRKKIKESDEGDIEILEEVVKEIKKSKKKKNKEEPKIIEIIEDDEII